MKNILTTGQNYFFAFDPPKDQYTQKQAVRKMRDVQYVFQERAARWGEEDYSAKSAISANVTEESDKCPVFCFQLLTDVLKKDMQQVLNDVSRTTKMPIYMAESDDPKGQELSKIRQAIKASGDNSNVHISSAIEGDRVNLLYDEEAVPVIQEFCVMRSAPLFS